MPQKIVTADSHAISSFQECEAQYEFSQIHKIVTREERLGIDRGNVIAVMLEDYYRSKMEGKLDRDRVFEIIQQRLDPSALTTEDKDLIRFRFMRYYGKYRDENLEIIAVEPQTAFSKVIYEDADHLFVYEGRPDIIFKSPGLGGLIYPTDHKSRSQNRDIYFYNNQAMGYCWAARSNYFMYNYFGLQETGDPDKWFTRPTKMFTDEQIKEWKEDTIQWFFRIANTTRFLKSRKCQNQYGLCQYHKLCETTTGFVKIDMMKRLFKPNTHVAW